MAISPSGWVGWSCRATWVRRSGAIPVRSWCLAIACSPPGANLAASPPMAGWSPSLKCWRSKALTSITRLVCSIDRLLDRDRLAGKPVAAAPDLACRWRGEVRGAAESIAIAVALQEIAPRRRRLDLIDVEFRRQFGIARLQRRVHEVTADHGCILAAAKRECDMSRRMAWRRQNARVIADLIIVAHDVGLLGFDHRQHAIAERRDGSLGVQFGPGIEFGFSEYVARVRKRRHPTA